MTRIPTNVGPAARALLRLSLLSAALSCAGATGPDPKSTPSQPAIEPQQARPTLAPRLGDYPTSLPDSDQLAKAAADIKSLWMDHLFDHQDSFERVAAQIEVIATDVRPALEAIVSEVHPTLKALNRQQNLYQVDIDRRRYFGTLETLLDFTGASATAREIGPEIFSVSSQFKKATVMAGGGLGGTSAQGRVARFPGDIDFSEGMIVTARSSDNAAQALASTVREAISRAIASRRLLFLGMTAGTYPPDHPTAANKLIHWTAADIARGRVSWRDRNGGEHTFALTSALAKPHAERVVNTFWRGPVDRHTLYGEVTKVIRYEALDPVAGTVFFATPRVGQAYQEVGLVRPALHDDRRLRLIAALFPQIKTKILECDWVKVAKRSYTVARMSNDIAALNDVAPFLSGNIAHLNQVLDRLNILIEEVVKPGGLGGAFLDAATAFESAANIADELAQLMPDLERELRQVLSAQSDIRMNALVYDALRAIREDIDTRIESDERYAYDLLHTLRRHAYWNEEMERAAGDADRECGIARTVR